MPEPRVIHDFPTILALLSRGRYVEKINDKLGDMLDALQSCPEDKAKATLTLTFDVTRMQDRVDIKPTVKLKLPEEKGFAPTVLFAFEDGLSLEHPSQLDMFGGPRDAAAPRASA